MPSVPNELYFVLNTKIMLMSPCPKCVNQALWGYFVFTLMSPTTIGLIACRRESILHEITKLVLLNAWRQLYWGHRNTLCTSALQTLHTSVLHSSIKPQPQLQPHNIPKHHLLVQSRGQEHLSALPKWYTDCPHSYCLIFGDETTVTITTT